VTSASLFLGQALATPLDQRRRLTGLVMGFGAGTLLSAIAYQLIPRDSLGRGWLVALWFVIGALTYYVGDRLVDGRGGLDRQRIGGGQGGGSGAAMFIGALLDGLPEAFILGIGIAAGGAVSVAFVVAVFVSNIPQGVAGTSSLRAAGHSSRQIFGMWAWLTVACAIAAGAGFLMAGELGNGVVYAEAFAAGAVLVMLSDSMMPEAFQHGGRAVGLVTVFGYLVAAMLTVVS
jgi:ZIP family zinc transporter